MILTKCWFSRLRTTSGANKGRGCLSPLPKKITQSPLKNSASDNHIVEMKRVLEKESVLLYIRYNYQYFKNKIF